MYDVICVGSALLDIFLKSQAFEKVAVGDYADGVGLCSEYGGKTEVEELVVTSGGAGTNNAVSMARKGLKTALIAEVGKDLVAATIKEELVREGVDISMLSEVEGEETGLSSILVTPDGGRSALIYRGASKMLSKEDVRWDQLQARWLMISSLGGDISLLEGLIGHAKAHGIRVAVNPGKMEIQRLKELGDTLIQGTGTQAQKIFEGVDVFLVNREEAAMLTGLNLENETVWRGEWHIFGPKLVVVTDGKNGGMVWQQGERTAFTAEVVQAVEETGAGDAFGSGLVAGLASGKDLAGAIAWGKQQAASVVSFMGAKKGLLQREQLLG